MASSEWINQLARKSPAYKAGILAAVLAVLGLLYYQFRYSPLKDEETSAQHQLESLQKTNKKLKKDKRKWEKLILAKDRLDEKLKKNKISLPASSELPAFFLHLQKQAAAAGVTLKNWKRLKEKPVENYVKVPVQIEVAGTFYQINHYFYLLHETERIITIEDFAITEPRMEGGELRLTAKFLANTFRQADRPPDQSPEEGDGGNKGKKGQKKGKQAGEDQKGKDAKGKSGAKAAGK